MGSRHRRFGRTLAVVTLGILVLGGGRAWDLLNAVAASNAKVLCSAVFVSGRDLGEARAHSIRIDPPLTRVHVDSEARVVDVSIAGVIRRRAVFAADQGCIALPALPVGRGGRDGRDGRDALAFEPVPVTSSLPPAQAVDWPMGDRLSDDPGTDDPGTSIDPDRIEAAARAAFAKPEDHTAAFVVVHRGRIVAERYAPGIDSDTQLESWSMGKSVTATLVGLLIREGALRLDQPAPVPEWQLPDDPRAAITVADLLRMSSGLRFSFSMPSLAQLFLRGVPDHVRIYTGMEDVFRFAIEAPAEHPAGSVGRYRNSDPLVLLAIMRRIVEARGEEYLTWPQRALFDRIGIRRQVLETDVHGNFILTGHDYGTARNWARLGLLYLREGVWLGERLLPADFVRFVATPAPAWEEPVYGGLFWLNRTGRAPVPADAFWMGGDGDQRVTIVPSLDLVVVRLGHVAGGSETESHARALREAAAAVN